MYDLFISYSRKDDDEAAPVHGWLDAFIGALQAEHRRTTASDLKIFVDRKDIAVMADWEHRILEALRSSTLLMPWISPNYFSSRYCYREWKEFVAYESAGSVAQEGVAPVYFITVPGLTDEGTIGVDDPAWGRDLARRQRLDIRDFVETGIGTVSNDDFRRQIEVLNEQITQRLERAWQADASPGTVERHNPRFVGRQTELRDLREALALGAVGVIASVHGLGGTGKTALASEYAHSYAAEYSGGRWLLRCRGQRNLATVLPQLAVPLGISFTQDEATNPERASLRILAELQRRTMARGDDAACLLLFDDVDNAELLGPSSTGILPHKRWLQVLATTRLDPGAFGQGMPGYSFLPLDELSEDDALRLIELHQPGERFADKSEQEDSLEIVRALGCFALAVEAAAIFLGLYPDVRPGEFLERIRQEGVFAPDHVARDEVVAARVRHREKLVAVSLEPTLARLSPEERYVLEVASQLPEGQIPLSWLRVVTGQRFPAFRRPPAAGHPDPWLKVERRLKGMRLIIPTGDPRIVRMHKLVRARVLQIATVASSLRASVLSHATSRAKHVSERWEDSKTRWEVEPLLALAQQDADAQRFEPGPLVLLVVGLLLKVGRRVDAEPIVDKALKSRGSNNSTELQTYSGMLKQRAGCLEEAELIFRDVLTALLKQGDAYELSIVGASLNLTEALWRQGRCADAKREVQRAVSLSERALDLVVEPAVRLPEDELEKLRNGRSAQVCALIEKARAIAEAVWAPNVLANARPLTAAESAQCVKFFERSHGHIAAGLPVFVSAFAGAHNLLGQILLEEGSLEPAEREARRLLAIEQVCPTLRYNGAAASSLLARILAVAGHGSEGEPEVLERKALETVSEVFGEDHPNVVPALNNLGLLLIEVNRAEEAEPLLRRAVGILESAFGQEHVELANTLSNLGWALHKLGARRFSEAAEVYRRAIGLWEGAFGEDHPSVGIGANNLAAVLRDADRLTDAEFELSRAVRILASYSRREHRAHPKLAPTLKAYRSLLVKLGVLPQQIEKRVSQQLGELPKALAKQFQGGDGSATDPSRPCPCESGKAFDQCHGRVS